MKKRLSIVLVVVLTVILLLLGSTSVAYGGPPSPPVHKSKSLEMSYVCVSSCCCGPSSGTSIGQYYEDSYPILPSDSVMYDQLYAYMDTFPSCYTDWRNYGPGFVDMALHYGYYNFGYVYYDEDTEDQVDDGFYWTIMYAIDNGWPVALASIDAFNGWTGVDKQSGSDGSSAWPPDEWHWIAIRGYDFWYKPGVTWAHQIICTDSYCGANHLYLDWNQIVDEVGVDDLVAVIIKDEIPEDFEWGSMGTPLTDSGGDVTWYDNDPQGASFAEINTGIYHGDTGRSAQIYRYGSNNVRAWYLEDEPVWRGFWLMKGDAAEFRTRTGNAYDSILVRVNTDEKLQYNDGVWKDTDCTLDHGVWYFIEFRKIEWDDQTYNIYVDGEPEELGCSMHPVGNNGKTEYISNSGAGSYYIDDISSSWW